MLNNYNKMRKRIAITIDVESDWGGRMNIDSKNRRETCRGINEGLPVILDMLDKFKIKATFFISGELFLGGNPHSRNEDSITLTSLQNIAKSGHEIASHGFKHEDHSRLSRSTLIEEIKKSRDIIWEYTGIEPVGFRAPQFKISDNLFGVLSELGFTYDSSTVRGTLPGRYRGFLTKKEPFKISFRGDKTEDIHDILEIPVSTIPYLRMPLGIRWINLIGTGLFRSIADRLKFPETVVSYLHPFDMICPDSCGDSIYPDPRSNNLNVNNSNQDNASKQDNNSKQDNTSNQDNKANQNTHSNPDSNSNPDTNSTLYTDSNSNSGNNSTPNTTPNHDPNSNQCSNSKQSINPIIRRWYGYKAGNVKDTLENFIDYWKNKGRKFVLMKDITPESK